MRDVGPLRFEADAGGPQMLDLLIGWKSRQYRRIRAANVLERPGVRQFLERLLAFRDDEFRGVLSAIYFGDRVAAVHLGIRCGDVLHFWFPAYDEDLAKYSPGNIFFVEQARAAEAMGIRRADFGAGNEPFKTSFRSFGTQVAEGAVGFGTLATSVHRMRLFSKHWLQASCFHLRARSVYRGVRGLFFHGAHHEFHP